MKPQHHDDDINWESFDTNDDIVEKMNFEIENGNEINFNLCKHRFQSSHEKTRTESTVIEVESEMVKDDGISRKA